MICTPPFRNPSRPTLVEIEARCRGYLRRAFAYWADGDAVAAGCYCRMALEDRLWLAVLSNPKTAHGGGRKPPTVYLPILLHAGVLDQRTVGAIRKLLNIGAGAAHGGSVRPEKTARLLCCTRVLIENWIIKT